VNPNNNKVLEITSARDAEGQALVMGNKNGNNAKNAH
jgi:hypothetical protein